MQRRQILSAAAGLGAGLLAPHTRAQGNSIVLGQSAALSGPASELGEQFKRGALLHFDRVNARGGIGGRPIELVSLDDGYEQQNSKNEAKGMTESHFRPPRARHLAGLVSA